MANTNNQPGESTLKNNQTGRQQQDDDPRQAKESGEPQVEGRMHGRPADEKSDTPTSDQGGDSKDWESGRHQAT